MQKHEKAVDTQPWHARTELMSTSGRTNPCGHSAAEVTASARLAQLLELSGVEPPVGLRQAARRLAMAPRTLQRRLMAEGVTYRAVLDAVRARRAEALLMLSSSASIDRVAHEMGFRDARAFHRAFKRWKGVPPGFYRQRNELRIPAQIELHPSGLSTPGLERIARLTRQTLARSAIARRSSSR